MLPLQNSKGATTVLSAAASLAASAMLIRTIANDLVPVEVHDYFSSTLHNIFRYFSTQHTIILEECKGDEFGGLTINELFEAADVYLGTKMSLAVRKLRVGMGKEEEELAVTVGRDEEIVDVFENVRVKWKLIYRQKELLTGDLNESELSEERSYELSFDKKHKDKVLNLYFPYILRRAKAIKEGSKGVMLHTGISPSRFGMWRNTVAVDHPMTFQTLAMDPEVKMTLMEDLDNFVNGKAHYKRSGKAWRRGYLLYGPPGTGKSSLIAAMANHLKYDIYEMDLTDLRNNHDLAISLLKIPRKAILVIEDIDCLINLQNREDDGKEAEAATGDEDGWVTDDEEEAENQVTVSSFLKLVEGLLSCCSEEHILVFTTNHREELNPAFSGPAV